MSQVAQAVGSLAGLAMILGMLFAGFATLCIPLMLWSLMRSARRIAAALETISERPLAPAHEDKAATGLRFQSR